MRFPRLSCKRKMTIRCTMKLITVAVPWAMTNATTHGGRRVVEQLQEEVVESDLDDEGQ